MEVEREDFGEANRMHGMPFVARCGALKAVRSLSLDRHRVTSECDYERGGQL